MALRCDAALDLSQAEDAMWAWYLEWSRIARNAIEDRSVLRRLGFLQNASGGTSEDVETDDTASALEAVPVGSSVGTIAAPQLPAVSATPEVVAPRRLVAGD